MRQALIILSIVLHKQLVNAMGLNCRVLNDTLITDKKQVAEVVATIKSV